MPRSRRRIAGLFPIRSSRRRSVVGKFVEPPIRPLASIESVVDDGVTIALSAVRLSVKNHILVAALRDHMDYDTDALAEFTRNELGRLADESKQTAVRIELATDPLSEPPLGESAVNRMARKASERRPRVERQLAKALSAASEDPELVAQIVLDAQDNASAELQRAVGNRLVQLQFDRDPLYETERATRLRALVAIDIDRLLEPPSY